MVARDDYTTQHPPAAIVAIGAYRKRRSGWFSVLGQVLQLESLCYVAGTWCGTVLVEMIGVTNRRFADAAIIFPVICFVVVRRFLGGPIFRGEFVVEDFILLLALASGVVPSELKPLIRSVVVCALTITMALIGLHGPSLPSRLVPIVFFALIGVYAVSKTLVELFRLRRRRAQT